MTGDPAAVIPRHAAACVYCKHGPGCRMCAVELPKSSPMSWIVCERHLQGHAAWVGGPAKAPQTLRGDEPGEPEIGSRRVDCYGRVWVRTYVPLRDGIRVLWSCWDADLSNAANPISCSWEQLTLWLAVENTPKKR